MRTITKLMERVQVICPYAERGEVYAKYSEFKWVSTIPVSDNGKNDQIIQITFERLVANVSAEEYLRRSR